MLRRFPNAKRAICGFRIGLAAAIGLSTASLKIRADNRDFLVEKWTIDDGLPSSTVMGLAQTQDGFLWVGTDRGLARFDGAQFTLFNRDNLPGLRSDRALHMGAGPDSQVYVGTWEGGFTVLNRGRARTFSEAEGTKNTTVNVVLPVGPDEAWFGADKGYLYHYRYGAIAEVGAGALPRESIYGLARAPDGRLWVGTKVGLFYLENDRILRYEPKIPLPGDGVYDLAVTDKGKVFMSNDRGLFQIESSQWRRWSAKNGLPSDLVNVLTAAPGDILWLGTDVGVAQLSGGKVRSVETPYCPVTSLLVDQEQSLWIGCHATKGLLRLRKPPVRMLSLPMKFQDIGTQSLAEDKSGAVWMATPRGLLRWRDRRSILYARKNGLPSDNIESVSVAPDGSVWAGTDDGFANIREGRIRAFSTREKNSDNPVYAIAEDRSGALWLGEERGLLRHRPRQAQLETVPNVGSFIGSVKCDREGNIWAASAGHGLFLICGDTQTHFTTSCGLASNTVYDTAEADNGDMWVATEGGLSRIRNGKCTNIRADNGLPRGRVVAVGCDSRGHLWVKATTAVFAVDLADANRVADSGGMLAGLRLLGNEDGFGESLSDKHTSILMHSTGEVWVPTLSGVGRIDPATLRMDGATLNPQVDSLASDFGEHDLAKPLLVSPGDLHLRFSYSAHSLVGTKTREFRYRLAGFDQAWRAGGKQRDAVYTSLPPGNYRFQLAARRPLESWTDLSAPLEIRVLPHFYETWWWYTLAAAALITAVLVGYRLRLATVQSYYASLMEERLRERSRLARELHDTLAQGMSGIHIQIEAAQVLLDADPSSIRKHLESVERIAREAAIQTRRSIAALRSEMDVKPTLGDTLGQAAEHFTRTCSIPLTVKVEEDLPRFSDEVCHEITRFAEEGLANVRQHSEAMRAYLTASSCEGSFRLRIEDDGKGFEMSAESGGTSGHFGITGMQERARRVDGRFSITSVRDKGTLVALEVPLLGRRKDRGAFGYRRVRGRIRDWIKGYRWK